MGKAMFYHLTGQRAESVLAMLLERSLGAGWRVYVRGRDPEAMARMDEALWLTGPDDGFLPHGIEGGAFDEAQPILLGTGTIGANGATVLVAIDGAPVLAEEVHSFERVCILFDGTQDAALNLARGQWKSLAESGVTAEYWSQDGGRWTKKAETNSSAHSG